MAGLARAAQVERAALYDEDLYSWALDQAQLLRERRFAEVDLPNVVEELESLGREQAARLRQGILAAINFLSRR